MLVAGSYNSALISAAVPVPPTARTLPLPSSVAVCPDRAVASEPAAVQVLVAGSYNSAVANGPLAPFAVSFSKAGPTGSRQLQQSH